MWYIIYINIFTYIYLPIYFIYKYTFVCIYILYIKYYIYHIYEVNIVYIYINKYKNKYMYKYIHIFIYKYIYMEREESYYSILRFAIKL